MTALKFIPNGTTHLGRGYHLEMNGARIGYAYAKVTQNATGPKVRGTSYDATVTVLENRHFSGSRSTVTREIERALEAAK